MASPYENVSMAVFCDFENVALGVRDAKYEKFDIKRVLERLLLKGSIVIKKAYCDWDRYKEFKDAMHEANFELIEIPHIRQSGKNSADIRLVVDSLDLCYTKSHVNTFVIISGDSDFSPLVSKLRENAKQVIGVGVKKSTSDLLIANCDEFIFYDDLVRESQRAAAKRTAKEQQAAAKQLTGEDQRRKEELEARKSEAIETAVDTFDALVSERGDSGKIWASTLKQAIKRRKPGFNESYYGFRAFGNLLDEAQARGLLDLGRDEKSGTYVYRAGGVKTAIEPAPEQAPITPPLPVEITAPTEDQTAKPARQHKRGSHGPSAGKKVEAPGVGIQAPEKARTVTRPTTVPEDNVLEMPVTENPSPGPMDLETPASPAITVSEPAQETETAGGQVPNPAAPEETPVDKKSQSRRAVQRKPSLTRRPRKAKSLADAT